MTEPESSLTALERELMTYVEKLTEASEQSVIQFKELEEKSRMKIIERQTSIEKSLILVIESQVLVTFGLLELANSLGKNASISKEMKGSQKVLYQALEELEKKIQAIWIISPDVRQGMIMIFKRRHGSAIAESVWRLEEIGR